MRTEGAPSDSRLSRFRCEEGTIINVNRKTWKVDAVTRHTSKEVKGIQCMMPYHHYEGGEGIHFLPEVGAICLIAWPQDNTPPFIMGYLGAAAVVQSTDGAPETPTPDGAGSPTDASFRSRRLELNPGDIAFTTRDDNYIILRRGGVLQLGATPIAQRIYIPIRNYIKDFAENYDLYTFGGDVSWTVERQENDPSGNAPAQYVFHMNEFAQDAKATVRVRYTPLSDPGAEEKTAWDIHVSPQGIDKDSGEVTNEMYSLVLTTTGKQTEIIGANRSVTVKGDDSLIVQGSRDAAVTGTDSVQAQAIKHVASGNAVLGGAMVKLGSEGAALAAVLGPALLQWLASSAWPVLPVGAALVASPPPSQIAALQQILSTKVFLE